MNEENRKQLVCLLVELSIKETNHELNRFIDKRDRENSSRLIEVENAITTLLEYLKK